MTAMIPSANRKQFVTIPQAVAALANMERELDSAKSYKQIRKLADAAEALKILFQDVAEVKNKAELVVLAANARIGEEIRAIPKRHGPGRGKHLPAAVNVFGKTETGIPGTNRSRLQKIAAIPKPELKAIATSIQESGGDATVSAVLRMLKDGEIKNKRAAYEARADKGAKSGDLRELAMAGEKFAVIYADPPWEFKVYSGKGKQRSAERYYDTSSVKAICALPVAALAADDCALFMWAVMPELPGALEVIRAWGFEYKTAGFAWIKQNKSGEGIFTGMGYWTRANAELCLFATRGSPQRIAKDVPQVILSPVGEHSVKPGEARKRIERLLLGPYLELFAREPVEGWTVWGNEIPA
jgi:N6-adenosine-specific RNA methylase IME4